MVLGKDNQVAESDALVAQHASVTQRVSGRILVVDDNAVNQKVVLHMLERLGFAANAVGNGLEAIHALKQIPYDLVLMDCQMPEMDGYEATRTVRSLDSGVINHAIPIVALTAGVMQGDREKALAAGMNDFLSKPIDSGALADTLERWLATRSPATKKRTATQESIQNAVEERSTDLPEEAVYDRLGVLQRLDNNAELLHILIEQFIQKSAQDIVSLKSSIASREAKEAGLHAHSIKGAASTVGAVAILKLAGKMESAAREADFDQISSDLPELERRLAKFATLATGDTRIARQ